MGFFKNIFNNSNNFVENKINKNYSNIELAEKVFNELPYGDYTKSIKDKEIKYAVQGCQCRQDTLCRVVELCGEPDTPRKRYLIATAYAWSTAPYRKKAIEYIKLYLKGPLYEKEYMCVAGFNFNTNMSIDEKKNIHMASMYHYLAKAYEGEKMYEEAKEAYKMQEKLTPFWPSGYIGVADILIRQEKLNEALLYLENTKKLEYYNPVEVKNFFGEFERYNSDFKECIDNYILNIKDKIHDKEEEEKDKINYEFLLQNLPKKCPKTFKGYRRMKKQNTENFKELKYEALKYNIKI